MKKIIVFSILAMIAFTACQTKEIEEPIKDNSTVFTAIVEDGFSGDTKTSLDGSGNVLWKLGDQVSVFAASTVNEQYQVSDASDGKTAATLNKIPAGGFVAGTEIDNNVAFYPYASTTEIAKSVSNYVISEIELPATQTYAAGSFGNGAFPMAAVTSSTEDNNFKFKNVLGGLKLQLKGTATITSITVTGNNDEILCGDAEVTTAYGGVPSIVLSDASAKTVTLNCGAGVTLDSETATSFIIALPPMTMTGGFTVVVSDSESKQMEITTSKSQTITRSNLLKMPAVNYVGTASTGVPEGAVDLGLSVYWAAYNLCEDGFVSSSEQYGDYYAWGETETHYSTLDPLTWKDGKESGYTWASYKWCEGTSTSITKYNSDGEYGVVDNRTSLEPEDDVAHVKLGSNWRTPSRAEWQELIDYCTWTWTTLNGVDGFQITSNFNGNSIFLPAAGYYTNTSPLGVGSVESYWARRVDGTQKAYAQSFHRNETVNEVSISYRCYGLPIRPVRE